MKPYHNLPLQQRRVQGLVDEFNSEERLWRRLKSKGRERLIPHTRLSHAQRKVMELIDYFLARPLQGCIGFFKGR